MAIVLFLNKFRRHLCANQIAHIQTLVLSFIGYSTSYCWTIAGNEINQLSTKIYLFAQDVLAMNTHNYSQ